MARIIDELHWLFASRPPGSSAPSLSPLASGAPKWPTFARQLPTCLLCPNPPVVPPHYIRPHIFLSTVILVTPRGCVWLVAISATLSPLVT